jgi:hypothetical protein
MFALAVLQTVWVAVAYEGTSDAIVGQEKAELEHLHRSTSPFAVSEYVEVADTSSNMAVARVDGSCRTRIRRLGYSARYADIRSDFCENRGLKCKVFLLYFRRLRHVLSFKLTFDFTDTLTHTLLEEGAAIEKFQYAMHALKRARFRTDRTDIGAFPVALWLLSNCIDTDDFLRNFRAKCSYEDFDTALADTQSHFMSRASTSCHLSVDALNCKYAGVCPTTTTTTTTPTNGTTVSEQACRLADEELSIALKKIQLLGCSQHNSTRVATDASGSLAAAPHFIRPGLAAFVVTVFVAVALVAWPFRACQISRGVVTEPLMSSA